MKNLIAVYGTLRKNFSNCKLLKNSKYLGTFNSEPIFSLYSLGCYPGLKQNGTTSVVMEVYEINDRISRIVDMLEGYTPNEKAHFYDKVNIDTPYGLAKVYIYVNEISKNKLINSGDWSEYKTGEKWKKQVMEF